MTADVPIASRQAVSQAIQKDIANGRHLLCVSGPRGSGKTSVLRALQEAYRHGLTISIAAPAPGNLLHDVLTALDLGSGDGNMIAGRRRLALRLGQAEEHKQPIVILVDAAQALSRADADILFHFFAAGRSAVVLAGEGNPAGWPACGAVDDVQSATAIYRLEPLSLDETAAFVRTRLEHSARLTRLLDASAVDDIHRRGGGQPGGIAWVCANLLAQFPCNDIEQPETAPGLVGGTASTEAEPASALAESDSARDVTTDLAIPAAGAASRSSDHTLDAPRPAPGPAVAGAVAARAVKRRISQRFARGPRRSRVIALVLAVATCTIVAVVLIVPDRSEPDAPVSARTAQKPSSDAPAITTRARPEMLQTRPDEVRDGGPQVQAESTVRPALPAPDPIPDAYWQRNAAPPESAATDRIDAPPLPEAMSPPQTSERATERATDTEMETPRPSPPDIAASESEDSAADVAPPRSAAPPTLSADERAALGRLYADRAAHELRTGQRAAAAVSVARGLAADPRNRRLLNLRVMLRAGKR